MSDNDMSLTEDIPQFG